MGMGEEILVIKTEYLFNNKDTYFNGFSNDFDFESIILKNYEWKIRTQELEDNPEFKQPIAYVFIVNKKLNKIFSYQRAKKSSDYNEKKLFGKWTWGVGGHIDKVDGKNNNPIISSMYREISEEAPCNILGVRKIGYINDDSNDVGKVHFGILYIIETDNQNIIPKDKEITNQNFMSIEELEKIISNKEYDVETWSRIGFEYLKKELNKN